MTKKIGDKKLGGVKSTTETSGVEGTEAVSGVGGVAPTSGVGGVQKAGAIGKRRGTTMMSAAEREQLYAMINEEADKLFGKDGLPPERKQIVQSAVKMAIAAAGTSDDEDDGSK